MTVPTQFSRSADPQMSIILVTDAYQTIKEVIAHLREQSVRDRLEIVIVTPTGQPLVPEPGALEGFAQVRLVEVGSILPLGEPRAAGVRMATAPIVVIGETHSYPRPGWAEALIQAHTEPWAVVVPAFGNANPETPLSWAAFLRDYGRWVDGLPAREIDFVPPYNTATKRNVLLEFGGRLDRMVSQGDELGAALQAQGHRIYFQPAAKIDHANVCRPMAWLVQRFLTGRVLAAGRAQRWSPPRRMLYACGAPLIPVVVLLRLLTSVRITKQNRRLPLGTLPAMVIGAIASAAGEMVTYAAGAGRAVKLHSDEYELHKLRYTYLAAP